MPCPKPGFDFPGVSVGAMIFNSQNHLFLAKRGPQATNERGCWEIPGGKVEFGETLQQAIKREIKEEYNLDIILLHQMPAQNHILPEENQHWVPTTFIAKPAPNQTPIIQEPQKCSAIGWFSLDKLPSPLSQITQLDLQTYHQLFSY